MKELKWYKFVEHIFYSSKPWEYVNNPTEYWEVCKHAVLKDGSVRKYW